MMEKFELVPPYREYETPDSFVSRLAALNQMDSVWDMARLLGESNQPSNNEARFRRFATMAGVDPGAFAPYTPKPAQGYMGLGDHQVHSNQVCKFQARLCPACVLQDVENGKGPIGARTFQRFWWLWTVIEKCPDHGCDMMTAGSGAKRHAPDLSAYVSQNLASIRRYAAEHSGGEPPHPLDTYLHGRLVGNSDALDMLDELPLAYAVRLCEVVGRDEHDTDAEPENGTPEKRRAGFDLLALGRDGFFKHLELHARNFDSGRGLNRHSKYGRLYTLLSKEAADPTWTHLRELVWQDACRTLPLAPGEEFLGHKLEKRLVHSLRTASKEYGLHPKTIMKMLNSDILASEEVHRAAYHSTVFSVEAVEKLFEEVHASVTTTETRRRLGLTHAGIKSFREANFLRMVDAGSAFGEGRPRYRREDIEHIVSSLEAFPVGRIRGEFRPFLTVFKWGRMCTTDAYQMVLDGKIRAVRKTGEARFDSLYIAHWDVVTHLPGARVEGISIKNAGRLLGTSHLAMASLIEHGFLVPGERMRKFGFRPVAYLNEADVLAFKAKYGGMTSIANELGIAVKVVSKAIAAAGIEPLYPATRTQGKKKEPRMFERLRVVEALRAVGALKEQQQGDSSPSALPVPGDP